jgi:hypothetical protein
MNRFEALNRATAAGRTLQQPPPSKARPATRAVYAAPLSVEDIARCRAKAKRRTTR